MTCTWQVAKVVSVVKRKYDKAQTVPLQRMERGQKQYARRREIVRNENKFGKRRLEVAEGDRDGGEEEGREEEGERAGVVFKVQRKEKQQALEQKVDLRHLTELGQRNRMIP